MKFITCLVLFCCVCSCFSDGDIDGNYFLPIFYNGEKNYDHQQKDDEKDSKDPIYRPCSFDDKDCIRSYFAHNAYCSPTRGPAPDPYRMKTLPLDVAHANITFILGDVKIKGFNDWKVKEFYINKKTDNLVLEVEFDSLKINSTANVIRYNRKGKEPLEIRGPSSIDYKNLSITMTLPHIRNLDLSKAMIFCHISDVAPDYQLDSKYTDSKDPDVIASTKILLGNIGLSLQEAFIKMGPVFMSVLVQSSICDFYIR